MINMLYNIKIGVIMLGGERQEKCFWYNYNKLKPGIKHDLIVVHRNELGLPKNIFNSSNGNVILENKIDNNGNDIPHKAFGAYRYFFNKYKDDYDYFIFISDDVVLKRDNWLLDIIETLNISDIIGFGASQIFNGNKKYPHETHIRSPFWFAKSIALKNIIWEFNSDHDGEMNIGKQLTNAGYVGVQVGNKINLGYDCFEDNHITQLIEQKFFNNNFPYGKYNNENYNFFMYLYENNKDYSDFNITSPYNHINIQNVLIDIEPFDKLIYIDGLDIAKNNLKIKNIGNNINILDV